MVRPGISLDGKWDIIVDPYENGFYNYRYQESTTGYFRNAKPATPEDLIEYDFARSPKLNIPGDWNTQDDKLFWYEGTIWYHRDIELSVDSQYKYVLYFGAVNYKAIAYVNGKKVGTHEGGFTPFQFDISGLIKDGTNSIVIKVDNRRERDQVPTVNTDWWNYGGVTRSVRILTLLKNHIDDYQVRLADNKNNEIAGYVHVVHDGDDTAQQVSLRIPALNINKKLQVGKDGVARFSTAAKPSLWSPEHPNLYAVELEYGEDKFHDDIGFRNIEVRGEDILLNGKSIFFKGISIHEESPLHPGRAWSDEDAEQLLSWAKDLGCNFVRLAHYPHNEAMLRAADRMGLMVWSEIPVYWTVLFDNATVYDKAELQLREMIARDKNRASVMLWSVANETPKSTERLEFLTKLIKTARSLDNSRLITAALDTQSDDHGAKVIDDPLASQVDVIGINTYCGWYAGKPDTCASLKWISRYHKP
ncbi:MAG TPA: glycoside hydrolase family 2 TIM barrel-domain containing protein, partial [Steroidobacteraceae bacterium]|nr:glycoside hydrolase family 2 TIM barrel-domain containing protein [Steroidobacteraceae bacterium]